VTLRNDIHSAIDDIAPPAPALAGRIAYLAADARQQSGHARPVRRVRWVARLGRSGSLVAALLIVLLMASLVVGVRAWRDRNILNEGPTTSSIDLAVLAQLESRPLLLAARPVGAECLAGPLTSVDAGHGLVTVLGAAPAYAVGSWHGATATKWGTYSDWLIATDPDLTGPVLVRGRDLEANLPVVFVGPHAAGDVVGTDTIAGKTVQQRSEAVFDAGHHDPAVSGTSKWGLWPMTPGVDKSESGCIAFQIDGPSFSEIVISVDAPSDHHH
jgi:hypothetical protein